MVQSFKQFLIEDSDENLVKTLVTRYVEHGDLPPSAHEHLLDVINNKEKYKNIIYSGPAYRLLNLNQMLDDDKITDIRQVTKALQRYDQNMPNNKLQSWTKDKKIALRGLKSHIWTDNDILSTVTFVTVTIEGNITGLDVNAIIPNIAYSDEHEVLAPVNVPINIIGFSLDTKTKQGIKFFSVTQFKEFAKLYNSLMTAYKQPTEQQYKEKRARKKRVKDN